MAKVSMTKPTIIRILLIIIGTTLLSFCVGVYVGTIIDSDHVKISDGKVMINGEWVDIGTKQATDYLIACGVFPSPIPIKTFNSPMTVEGEDA